jgi:hypothetical protein
MTDKTSKKTDAALREPQQQKPASEAWAPATVILVDSRANAMHLAKELLDRLAKAEVRLLALPGIERKPAM